MIVQRLALGNASTIRQYEKLGGSGGDLGTKVRQYQRY